MKRVHSATFAGVVLLLGMIAATPLTLRHSDSRLTESADVQPLPKQVAASDAAPVCISEDTCDAYDWLRTRDHHSGLDDRAKSDIARQYLEMGLPWRAEKLGKDSYEGVLARRALLAMSSRAATVVPESVVGSDVLAKRIWQLLGLPSVDVNANLHFTRPNKKNHSNQSPDGLPLFQPVIRALYLGKYRPDVERAYGIGGLKRGVFTKVKASSREIEASIARARKELLEGRKGPGSAVLLRLYEQSEMSARFLAENENTSIHQSTTYDLMVTEVRPSRFGTLITFAGNYMNSAALFLRRESDGYWQYFFECMGALTVTVADVDDVPGGVVFFQSLWRSDNDMSLKILYPSRGITQDVALDDDYLNQKITFIELDGDPAPEIAVNLAFDENGDAIQAPHQRGGYLLKLDRKQEVYRAIGSYHNGADEYDWGGSGMLISPLLPIYDSTNQAIKITRAVQLAARSTAKASMSQALANAESYAHDLESGGLYVDASRMLEAVYEQVKGSDTTSDNLARITIASGIAMLLNGQSSEAYQRLRSIAEPSIRFRKEYWSALGTAAMQKGAFAEALNYFERPKVEGIDNSIAAGNRASFYYSIGAWGAAEDQAKQAIRMSLKESNSQGAGIMMLLAADTAYRKNDFESAIDWLAQAVRTSFDVDDGTIKPNAYKMAANIALSLKRPQLAEALLDNALYRYDTEAWQQAQSTFLLLYGRIFEQEGNLAFALRAYRTAAMSAENAKGLNLIQSWAEVGRLYDRLQQQSLADDAYRRAFSAMIESRRQIPTETFKLKFLQNVQDVADNWLGREFKSEAPAERLANDVEAWKFKIFSDIYGTSGSSPERNAAESLGKLLRPNEAYISYFVGHHGSFASIITRGRIQTKRLELDPESAHALKADITRLVDPSDATARSYIEARRISRSLNDALDRAYIKLIAPLDLPSNIDTLVISPDENLTGLPWAAIHVGPSSWWEDVRWSLGLPKISSLLDRYTIALSPSAELAERAIAEAEPAPRPGLIVAVGGAVPAGEVASALSLAPVKGISPLSALQAAGEEALVVARALPGSTVLSDARARMDLGTGGAATRAALLAALPHAGFFHFSGHGAFNVRVPMESALFLDQSAQPGQRVVTASDIAHLDLRSIRFAALSACETGVVEADIGAESFGFLRALLAARVRSVILMGWEVDDNSTAVFYNDFYKHYGEGTAQAYRKATLDQRSRYINPYYWAAGDYYGSWR